MWTGAISFGLVTVPVKIVPATENHSVSFRQIHLEDGGRVRYQKRCSIDGEELSADEIGRAYEVDKDTVVPITDTELDSLPLPTARAIEIVSFVPAASIDPIRLGTGNYWLALADQVAAKAYVLLVRALERSEKVAVAKFAFRDRERLGLLRVKDGAILMHGLKWDDEVRDPAELAPAAAELSSQEIKGALALMETMTSDTIPDAVAVDHYTEALEELIHARAEHRIPALVGGEAPEPAGKVVDLMAALNASVEAARAGRGEPAGAATDATVHDLPKKRTAKKKTTATKKAAPRKATAKTAGSRKPRSA
ncbi:Ku protein [Streptomyces sp. NPDC052000]|uniref:non-homologous end joining protein Ku n=1 Tax=Streptomyces sp. NPDC052000 TaxID=3155676 RepID=UPI00344F1FB1